MHALKVWTSLCSPPSGSDDGASSPERTPAASQTIFSPRGVRRIPIFRRDRSYVKFWAEVAAQTFKSISPGRESDRDAAGVCSGGGAPSSEPSDGEQRDVCTLSPMWTSLFRSLSVPNSNTYHEFIHDTMALLPPPASPCFLSSFIPRPPSLTLKSTTSLACPKRRRSLCTASWQELVGVVVFSAVPFTAVKAIANSALGDSLQRRLEERKKAAVENSSRFKALAQNARNRSLWYGEERPRWLGPIPYDYPEHLTGELPGDYGFDVVGLSKDPVAFQRYFNFEILHARWAMLAAFGALVPEILDLLGLRSLSLC
ncbi:hypothetical protein ACLB2K_052885 [Fragaria x ananassa]